MGEPERHSDRMTNAEVMAYAKGAAAGAFLALEPRVGDEDARAEAKWIAATAIVNLLADSDWPFPAVEVRQLRDMLDDWLDHMEAM